MIRNKLLTERTKKLSIENIGKDSALPILINILENSSINVVDINGYRRNAETEAIHAYFLP